MVVHIKKKRRRGERTYHGSHKKWRGGGSRGGRGKAGMHKHKWTFTVKYEKDHFGKFGFKRPINLKRELKVINLDELNELIEKIEDKNYEEGKIRINLDSLGYDKLLGRGKVEKALIVEVRKISRKAERKIEESGGRVIKI